MELQLFLGMLRSLKEDRTAATEATEEVYIFKVQIILLIFVNSDIGKKLPQRMEYQEDVKIYMGKMLLIKQSSCLSEQELQIWEII